MPIKGMTDPESTQARLPVVGVLRKGGEKEKRVKNGKEIEVVGKDLDHFRFTSDNEAAVAAFRKAYGEAPKELFVYLPYPDIDRSFPTWIEMYAGKKLVHRCDGETVYFWRDEQGAHAEQRPCELAANPPREHKPIGRLYVILPKLWEAGFVGLVVLKTTSKFDIVRINSVLAMVLERKPVKLGGLTNIPFALRRVLRTISRPGDGGNRIPIDKYMVELEPPKEFIDMMTQFSPTVQGEPEPGEDDDEHDDAGYGYDGTGLPANYGQEDDDAPDDPFGDEFGNDAPGVEGLNTGQDAGWQTLQQQLDEARKASKPEPQPATNGKPKLARPMDPQKLALAISTKADADESAAADFIAKQGLRGLTVAALEALFPNDLPEIRTAKRHALLRHLFGVESSARLTTARCNAILAWAQDSKRNPDGTTTATPNPDAMTEAEAAVQVAGVHVAQPGLPTS